MILKKKHFSAIAREPLKIEHKGLGYLITYDLVSFIKKGNYVSYLGYARYKNLKGRKAEAKTMEKEESFNV